MKITGARLDSLVEGHCRVLFLGEDKMPLTGFEFLAPINNEDLAALLEKTVKTLRQYEAR